MRVEAFALCDLPVEFVTGINYWKTTQTFEGDSYMGSWGLHPEDIAAFQFNVGGCLIYNPDDIATKTKTGAEILLASKPTQYLASWISRACEKRKALSRWMILNRL